MRRSDDVTFERALRQSPSHVRFHTVMELVKLLQDFGHRVTKRRDVGDALQELRRMQGDLG